MIWHRKWWELKLDISHNGYLGDNCHPLYRSLPTQNVRLHFGWYRFRASPESYQSSYHTYWDQVNLKLRNTYSISSLQVHFQSHRPGENQLNPWLFPFGAVTIINSLVPRLPRSGTRTLKLCGRGEPGICCHVKNAQDRRQVDATLIVSDLQLKLKPYKCNKNYTFSLSPYEYLIRDARNMDRIELTK